MRQRNLINLMRAQRSVNRPFSVLQTSRIGVVNRYQWDYACEDEYFEREMTLLESRTLPVPVPKNFRHASLPENDIYPPHWNDVMFNFKPQNIDRRVFVHDNFMNCYDFHNGDALHTFGYVDEDMEYEQPDPFVGMHFLMARSQVTSAMGIIIVLAVTIGYPIFGLKVPQKDNPFYYRKKYASTSSIH